MSSCSTTPHLSVSTILVSSDENETRRVCPSLRLQRQTRLITNMKAGALHIQARNRLESFPRICKMANISHTPKLEG
jgi:hypothetical protein